MFCGHAVPEIVRAVRERVARSHPVPAADRGFRSRSPKSSHGGTRTRRIGSSRCRRRRRTPRSIRLARAVTDREVVVLFEGHYHGHFEEGLVDRDGSPQHAVAARPVERPSAGRVRIAQFNDADSLAEALAPGDVALVLTEPVMSNGIHLLAPIEGWHDDLRRITREHGTFLAVDETHSHVVGEGGASGPPRTRAGHPHDRQGRGGRDPDGRLRCGGHPRAGARRRAQRRDGRHPVREPAVRRRGARHAYRGLDAGRLRARDRCGFATGQRDRGRDRRGRPAVDDDPLRTAQRPVVRPRTAHGRRGARAGRHGPHASGPHLAGQPGHLGGASRRRPDLPRSRRPTPTSTDMWTPTPSCCPR